VVDRLTEPVPGEKQCLKCQKIFTSKDVKRNRLCTTCVSSNSRLRGTKVGNPHSSGRRGKTPGSGD
jgi:Zn finger protein HypA/HybF involved in hydrogenase expression